MISSQGKQLIAGRHEKEAKLWTWPASKLTRSRRQKTLQINNYQPASIGLESNRHEIKSLLIIGKHFLYWQNRNKLHLLRKGSLAQLSH